MVTLQELINEKMRKYNDTPVDDPEFLRVVEAAITLQNEELDILKIWSQAILIVAQSKGLELVD